MSDLSPGWIKVKGVLFLLMGIVAAALLVLEHPTLKTGLLLFVAIWSFCRFYYFAFYVIEHYVDPGFRFAGLYDFAMYMIFRRRGDETPRGRGG